MKPFPDQLIRIVAAGGGVTINAGDYFPEILIRIAAAAANSGATVIIKDASKLFPDIQVRIAVAGNGKVIFDFDDQPQGR